MSSRAPNWSSLSLFGALRGPEMTWPISVKDSSPACALRHLRCLQLTVGCGGGPKSGDLKAPPLLISKGIGNLKMKC